MTRNNFEFVVLQEEVGIRIDKFLASKFVELNRPEITRSKIQNLLEENLVSDDKQNPISEASLKTYLNQRIKVTIPLVKETHLVATKIDFEIVFEDDDLLVINKPAGLTVHPGCGNDNHTLVNALLYSHGEYFKSEQSDEEQDEESTKRPGIVHRLDKDTSGLMLVAKNDYSHFILSQDLQNRIVKRTYLAFIYGCMVPANGIIKKNIARSHNNRTKMAISKIAGRSAITHYKTKEIFHSNFASLVECRLETGRTHQIRVHLESEKHSLLGDHLYNSCKKSWSKDSLQTVSDAAKNLIDNFPRQALHSYKIGFNHPRSKKEMSFEIALPKDLQALYTALKNG